MKKALGAVRVMAPIVVLAVLAIFFAGCSLKYHNLSERDPANAEIFEQDGIAKNDVLRAAAAVREANEFFVKELGCQKTVNFQVFRREAVSTYHLRKTPKAGLSYDYSFTDLEIFTDPKDLQNRMAELRDKFDLHVYPVEVLSGGYPANQNFVRAGRSRQLFLALHEDWHDNIEFSYSLEESTGNIIGYLGAIKLLERGPADPAELRQARYNLEWTILKAGVVVKYYNLLDNVFKNQETTEAAKIIAKEKIIGDMKQEFIALEKKTGKIFSGLEINNATISQWMTYDRYMDIAWRVYLGTGKDLKRTAEIFRGIKPLSEYLKNSSDRECWENIASYEKEQVEYLEKFAVPLLVKNSTE